MPLHFRFVLLVCLAVARVSSIEAADNRAVVLEVDAREAPRKIFHAKLTIPASPGTLTLAYPKWIPGEHGPTGPIADLAGLHFSAGGKTLSWKRDSADLYLFRVDVPPGTASIEVLLDFLSPANAGQFSAGSSTT